jgi:hypothetical protein
MDAQALPRGGSRCEKLGGLVAMSMKYGIEDIDHIVSAVADAESAGSRLTAMGFTVTPLSVMNNVGVANRLVLFKPMSASAANFIELMGVTDPHALIEPLRPFLRDAGGYRWIVLSGPDAAATYEQLTQQRTYPFGKPIPVQRDWALPSGEVLHIAFNVMMPIDAPIPFNFCEYRTLQHYVRPEFLDHANGAETLSAILCCAEQPEKRLSFFEALFGARRKPVAAGIDAVTPGHVKLMVGGLAAWQDVLRTSVDPPHGLFACRIKVRDLTQTAAYFRRSGFAAARSELGLLLRSPLDDGTYFLFHD